MTSYTHLDPSSDIQESIVVGSYSGSKSDIAVLRWWYGTEPRMKDGGWYEFVFPAFDTSDGGPVPDAHLYVSNQNDSIAMVRITGQSLVSHAAVVPEIKQVSLDDWRERVRQVRASISKAPESAVVAESSDEQSWELTTSRNLSGNVELCLAIRSLDSTGCVSGDSIGPQPGQIFGAGGAVVGEQGAYVFGVVSNEVDAVWFNIDSVTNSQIDLVDAIGLGRVFVGKVDDARTSSVHVVASFIGGESSRDIPIN